jgi:hypothetical protein
VVEFIYNFNYILLITIYNSPSTNFDISSHFKIKFEEIGNRINKYTGILILGDFNENFLNNCEGFISKNAEEISLLFSCFGFKHIINYYTFPTNPNSIYKNLKT